MYLQSSLIRGDKVRNGSSAICQWGTTHNPRKQSEYEERCGVWRDSAACGANSEQDIAGVVNLVSPVNFREWCEHQGSESESDDLKATKVSIRTLVEQKS